MTTTTTHAGLTLRGVTPAEVVDRRPIVYINTGQSDAWRGDDPSGWLEERVGELLDEGVERVGLHQPGLPENWSGKNPLQHMHRLSEKQIRAIDWAAGHYADEVEWSVNLGGLMGKVEPLEGWSGSHVVYATTAMKEILDWAALLGRGRRFLAFLDGLGEPAQHAEAAEWIINTSIHLYVTANRRPALRLGTYMPDYERRSSVPDGADTAPVRLALLRQVRWGIDRGWLDLDHLDFLTREQHLWVTGHQERRERADGNRGYREIDDPILAEWADRGGIVSCMTSDPETIARCKEMTARAAEASVKLLEQREREETAKTTGTRVDPKASAKAQTSGFLIVDDTDHVVDDAERIGQLKASSEEKPPVLVATTLAIKSPRIDYVVFRDEGGGRMVARVKVVDDGEPKGRSFVSYGDFDDLATAMGEVPAKLRTLMRETGVSVIVRPSRTGTITADDIVDPETLEGAP